jgi:hypothetical protein
MSETLRRVQALVLSGEFRVSDHGFNEPEDDGILASEVIAGVAAATVVENYRDRSRGPSVLALQHDADGRPIHVVWAVPAGERRPAILVTAIVPIRICGTAILSDGQDDDSKKNQARSRRKIRGRSSS